MLLFGFYPSCGTFISDMSTTHNRPPAWVSSKWASDNRLRGPGRRMAAPPSDAYLEDLRAGAHGRRSLRLVRTSGDQRSLFRSPDGPRRPGSARPGSHPAEDDAHRLGRAEWRLVPKLVSSRATICCGLSADASSAGVPTRISPACAPGYRPADMSACRRRVPDTQPAGIPGACINPYPKASSSMGGLPREHRGIWCLGGESADRLSRAERGPGRFRWTALHSRASTQPTTLRPARKCSSHIAALTPATWRRD